METLASRHGVPQITMAGARILTDPVKEWLFSVTESDVMSARVIYEHMKSEGINKIGLLSSSAGYGRAAREIFIDQAAKNNIEVLMDETYAKGDSDMTAQLTRIRGNGDVQAIINLDAGNQPAIVTRNYVALGIKAPLYTSHSMAAPEFPSLAGKSSEGVRMNAATMLVAEQLPKGSTERELGMAFRKLYEDRYGHAPNTFAGYGHDALVLLVDAIRRAGSTDPAAIRDALEQTRDLVGVTSTLTFDRNNHGGVLEESSSRMVEVRDGGFVLIE
jgi:branched-chain amino acid transport system substrate-binding protein